MTKARRLESSRALAATRRHSPPRGELRALRRTCGDDEPPQQWLYAAPWVHKNRPRNQREKRQSDKIRAF